MSASLVAIMNPSPDLHILLAEDSPSQRAVLAEYCRQLPDATLHEASDGSWALRLCRELPVLDLVITDLNMPGMDGVEFLQHLSRPTSIPPLLLISSDASDLLENTVRVAEQLGFPGVACMKKPVDPEQFLAAIRQLLERKKIHHLYPASNNSMPLAEIIVGLAQNQFCAHYQPIFRLEDGRITQIEALARWQHPGKGLLLPGNFIDRLEHEGHIVLLTRLMTEKSLDLLTHLPDPELKVSLNLSRGLLQDAEFFDWLVEQPKRFGLEPSRVVLEITETMAFADPGHTLATLVRLRMRGFELSMDDFGTGHTNLEQIKDVPLTEIKFDRSLIKGIHKKPRNQAIVEGMARIARELSLRMVAEGLDNEQDYAFIEQRIPDTHLQGFLLARPVAVDVLQHILRDNLRTRRA